MNKDLFIWLIFIVVILRSLVNIIGGLFGIEIRRETHYDKSDVLVGIFWLFICVILYMW